MTALAILAAVLLAAANALAVKVWLDHVATEHAAAQYRRQMRAGMGDDIDGPDVSGLATVDACELVALRTPADIVGGAL